jgi:predicted NBD/HSP70 family sugar kinase
MKIIGVDIGGTTINAGLITGDQISAGQLWIRLPTGPSMK